MIGLSLSLKAPILPRDLLSLEPTRLVPVGIWSTRAEGLRRGQVL